MNRRILSMILALTFLLAGLLPTAALASSKQGTLVMTGGGKTLNLRAGAGTTYASVGYVSDGAAITVYDVTAKDSGGAEWTKIKVNSTGKTGYVKTKYISTAGSVTANASVYVGPSGGTVNVRKGPGTSYAILAVVSHGAKLKVLEKSGNWSRVIVVSSGKVGYISNKYVSTTDADDPAYATGNLPSGTYTAGKITTSNASSKVNLRAGAGTGYKSLALLSSGTKLRILSKTGSWYKVKTMSGKTGYVYASYIAQSFSAKTTGNVNLRKGAGTSYAVLKVVSKGKSITVHKVSGSWAYVTASGTKGWMYIKYIKY